MSHRNLPSESSEGDASPAPNTGGASFASRTRAGQPEDARLDLSGLLATLLRQRWMILTTCLVVTIAIAGYTYTQAPVYEASSLVRVEPDGSASRAVTEPIMEDASIQSSRSLSAEIGVLQNSVDIARRVAERLADRSEGNARGFPALEGTGKASGGAARRILDQVDFRPRPDRNIIEITAESRDPEEAAALANLYAQAYRAHSQRRARSSLKAARAFLNDQVQEQREKVRRLEDTWQSFALNNELAQRGQEGSRLAAQYNEYTSRRDRLAFELEKTQTEREMLRSRLEEVRPDLEQSVIANQKTSRLRTEIEALEETIARLRAEEASYFASNPDLKGDSTRIRHEFPDLARLRTRVASLEKQRQSLTKSLVRTASGDRSEGVDADPIGTVAELRQRITEKTIAVDQLQAQIDALDERIAGYAAELDEVPQQRVRREQIERQMQQARAFHETIKSELQKLTVARESELGYVSVVRSAFVPSAPVRPDLLQNIVLGLLLGLGFGIGLAFLRASMNTRIRKPEDVQHQGYNLLGAIPSMAPEIRRDYDGRDFIDVENRTLSTRLMPLLNPWSSVTENYRLVRANIQARDDASDTLLVTSARKGEGKTVTAVNYALTAALSGDRVLLIDADMRKPTAHNVLGMPRGPGLSDMLSDTGDASRAPSDHAGLELSGEFPEDGSAVSPFCWRTPVEGLHFVPAGEATDAPARTLESDSMHHLIASARNQFDEVVIDTPPTEAASDAVVIGSQTEASAVVVSEAESDARALQAAVRSLRSARASVAGVVVNRFCGNGEWEDASFASSYYDYDDEYAKYRLAASERTE
ncbi:GumC family protein [Longibacter sp.]|uniref:GumC family protein n=1 Tax=Longibacter sp. TaxID=2045415 RepID=UPI003EB87063